MFRSVLETAVLEMLSGWKKHFGFIAKNTARRVASG
jgi:hypothetical protein